MSERADRQAGTRRFAGAASPICVLILVGVTALAVRGEYPDAGDGAADGPTDLSRQSSLPLVLLAAVALTLVVLSLLSFLRRPSRRTPMGQALARSRKRRDLREVRDLVLGGALLMVMLALPVGAGVLIARLLPAPVSSAGADNTEPEAARSEAPPAADRAATAEPTPLGMDEADLRAAATAAVALVLVAGVAVLAGKTKDWRRRPRDLEPAVSTPHTAAAIRTALNHAAAPAALEIADPNVQPREGIMACYRVLERHFARTPRIAPTAADTPTEVLGRAVGLGIVGATTAQTLVSLFAEARFSTHPMSERDRARAVAALDSIRDDLAGERAHDR
ncbi:DUF4129 domain-containing protein [Nocardia cyriacigeorgica]|uniref:DUF4129 domain-containing protein n=1 Tax=Nocardia cyriacigeorgica TaxID=135487 RepID=UPI001894DC9A|nr:DUF4129 domain-containing protein [Nocardia cyriacigeorgica]MBF6412607.1 DUF4129 domain-containing protein [Nocardia cyriacigeorgica]